MPFFINIIGGIIGYFAVKNEDKPMANRLLILGVVMFGLVVSAGVILPAWVLYSLTSPSVPNGLQSNSFNSEQIIMDRYNFPAGGPLIVTLRNTASASENLVAVRYFFNETLVTNVGFACSSATALAPTDSCVVTLTLPTAKLSSGVAYVFKVITPTGGAFSYSIIYGSST